MATQRHTLTPAVRRAILANRKRILAREAAIAAALSAAWHVAQGSITPAQNALIRAYSAQLDALNADNSDDEEDSGPSFATSSSTVPMSWAHQSGHLPQLDRAVLLAVGSFAVASALHITDGQRIAVQAGATDAQALIKTALEPLHLSVRMVDGLARGAPQNVLDGFIGKSLTTGNHLSDLLAKLDDVTAQKVTKVLYGALASGSHPTVAARMLTDATGMARNRAMVVARTEMLNAYRSASLAQFRASSDVVSGWTWLAAPGACPFCASMDGTHHTLDEDLSAMTHPQCRCCPAPDTKSLESILSMFAA